MTSLPQTENTLIPPSMEKTWCSGPAWQELPRSSSSTLTASGLEHAASIKFLIGFQPQLYGDLIAQHGVISIKAWLVTATSRLRWVWFQNFHSSWRLLLSPKRRMMLVSMLLSSILGVSHGLSPLTITSYSQTTTRTELGYHTSIVLEEMSNSGACCSRRRGRR